MTTPAAARGPIQSCRRLAMGWLLLAALLVPALAAAQSPAASTPAARTVLVMGDSLSAGYGLGADEGWVPLTAARIAKEKPGWRVVNASISGETSAGGSSRIVSEVLRVKPAVVVIALGANDGLRGLPVKEMRYNLSRMIGASQHVGARVLIVGMRIPPNYGAEYTQAFEGTFADLSKRFDTALLPFLLQPIALERASFQDDNLHPTAATQPAIRDHVWTALAPLLD